MSRGKSVVVELKFQGFENQEGTSVAAGAKQPEISIFRDRKKI